MSHHKPFFKFIAFAAGLINAMALNAEKPDSAFGTEVWSREKELLQSIREKAYAGNRDEEALTWMKLAGIFKDSRRELEYLDRAERCADSLKDRSLKCDIMMQRLEHHAVYGTTDQFSRYALTVRGTLKSMKDPRVSNVEYLVIKRYIDEGRTQTALATAKEMLSDAELENDTYRQAYAYYSLGLIYQAVNRYTEAVESMERSEVLMDRIADQFPKMNRIRMLLELLCCQYNIGRYTESLNTCSSARKELNRFIEDSDPDLQTGANCRSMFLHIECYAARNYLAMNDAETAEEYLERAAGYMYPHIGLDKETYNETCASYFLKTGEYEKALTFADSSAEALRTSGFQPYYLEALKIKKDILAEMGNWKEAYRCQSLAETVKDSLDASRFASELNELHTIYEVDKMAAQKKRQQVIIFMSLLCCILLSSVVIAYVRYSANLQRKNQSLYEQINSNLRNAGSSAKVLQMTPEENLGKEMRLFRKISLLMDEEQPYRNPAFNRASMAKILGTNEKYVADAVREGAGTTVANYITDVRLSYSLELLSDEPAALDDIARDSGFGSYSSFWRAFLKKYSMTPSEYRSLHSKNS